MRMETFGGLRVGQLRQAGSEGTGLRRGGRWPSGFLREREILPLAHGHIKSVEIVAGMASRVLERGVQVGVTTTKGGRGGLRQCHAQRRRRRGGIFGNIPNIGG